MPPRPAVKRRKLASDSEDYSPTKRAKNSSVPRYLTRTSTRRTRSQSNQPYTRDPNNSDDSDGLVTTASTGRNNSGLLKTDMFMSGALGKDKHGNQDPKWKSKSKIASENASTESVENSSTVSEVNGDSSHQEQRSEVQVSASQSPEQDTDGTSKGHGQPKPLEDAQSQGEALSGSEGRDSTDSRSSKRLKSNLLHPPRRLSDLIESNETSLSVNSDEEFEPADASTPFVISKSTGTLPDTVPSSSPNSPTPKGQRKRILSSPRLQVPHSPPVAEEETPHSSPPEFEDSQERELDQGTQDSEPELPPLQPIQREITPTEIPPWMAPPASSSSPLKSPQVKKNNDPITTKSKSAKSLSTAALQSMLPKRRPHARKATPDEYDIPDEDSGDASVESASEEDELSYAPPRRTSKNTTKVIKATKKSLLNATNGKANAKVAKNKSSGAPKREQTTKSKQPSKAMPAKVTTSTIASTTNDSLDRPPSASSNKENRTKPLTSSPLSTPSASTPQSTEQDVSSGPILLPKPAAKNRAIKTLAKKFREVDEWSLDFEDGSLEHSSDRGKR